MKRKGDCGWEGRKRKEEEEVSASSNKLDFEGPPFLPCFCNQPLPSNQTDL